MDTTRLSCTCGAVELELRGALIITGECHCRSCRDAAARMQEYSPEHSVTVSGGGTPLVLYRKDRVEPTRGAEHLHAFRLRPDSPTRRVLATCCNTPIFLDYNPGHWLSVFASLWPAADRPRSVARLNTGSVPAGVDLPDGPPSHKTASPGFIFRVLGSWVAMGFRHPSADYVTDDLELPAADATS